MPEIYWAMGQQADYINGQKLRAFNKGEKKGFWTSWANAS
jgi:hypothetical protein